jgi:hypothetical protein
MAQNTVDNKSEAFKILQDNLSSSRGKDMSTDEVEKSIRGNKNLLKIYKEIEASLKKSGDLYKQNRKNLEYINELNQSSYKTLKEDQVARKQINDLNRQNIKYLDETQDLVRESLRNDIDSKKIKEKIQKLNNEIAKSERARFDQSDKIKESYKDVFDLIKSNKDNLKFGIGDSATKLISDLKRLETSSQKIFNQLATADNEADRTKYLKQLRANDVKQKKMYDKIDEKIVVEDSIGGLDKDATNKLRKQFDKVLSDAFGESSVAKTFSLSENILHDTVHELHQQQKRAEKSEKQIGVIGKIFDGLGKTPLNSLVDFNHAKDRMKDAGSLGESTSWSAVKSMAGSSAIGKAGMYGGGVMIIKEIISLMAKADDRVTKIARSFGIAKSEAGGIYDNSEGINTEFGKIGLNIDDIIDSQINFNTEFGYAVNLSGEMLKNIGQATKLIGLNSESTNELIRQSLTSSKEINQIEADILGQLSYQSKGLLGNKSMLEKVLNISGAIRANFKGNVSEITKAVVKAKEYGMTLEKTNQIGDSLLDWESSISNQLDARLITGKNINLEQARYYALMGNTAGLMDEIHKNVGDYESFYNMNVIQQQSFAKAVGMTRDELSDMYYEEKISQELIKIGNKTFKEDQLSFLSQSDKFKKEYSKIMNNGALSEKAKIEELGKIARDNISQMSAQQKFEAVLEKVKEKIAQLFGDGAVLDKMADGLIGLMSTFNLIGEKAERDYLAKRIVEKTNPNMSANSDEYKKLVTAISGYDTKTLKNKNDIVSLEATTDPKSPEYKNIKRQVIAENAGILDSRAYQSEMIDKLNQLIKVTESSGNKSVSFNTVQAFGAFKQDGLINPK